MGLREDSCVMVGETARIPKISIYMCVCTYKCIYVDISSSRVQRERGRTRRGVRRARQGERTLHVYHGPIWLSTGCDLELDSFEMMPVEGNTKQRANSKIQPRGGFSAVLRGWW